MTTTRFFPLLLVAPIALTLACATEGPLSPDLAGLADEPVAPRMIDLAERPTIDRFEQDFGQAPSEACGTFLAVPSGTQTVTIKSFEDRLFIQIVRQATWTNSVTGKSAKERSALNVIVDFETGRTAWNGNAGGMTIRGEGKVLHRSGKIIFEGAEIVFAAGHDRVLLLDSPPTLCDLLG